MVGLLAYSAALAAASQGLEVTTPGPLGSLAGTYESSGSGKHAAVAVIIPGSGPTDRDGNNPLGVKAQPYRLLADALAKRGIASVRIDKRGMFASRTAISDANDATIADYAADARAWARLAAKQSGKSCAWLIGHSEGGLVALVAAQDKAAICGIVLVSVPGRPIGTVMRDQFKANPANAPILAPALAMLDGLEAGRTTDPAALPAPLDKLFSLSAQRFLIAEMRYDPAELVRQAKVPVAIVQGDADLQVGVDDARRLASARTDARLTIVPGVNHVLKRPASLDRMANMQSYADPAMAIDTAVVDAVAAALNPKAAGRKTR